MFRSRRTLLAVGVALFLAFSWTISARVPAPAPLSASHASVGGLDGPDGCVTCHAPGGLAAGCLGCHVEIGAQLETDRGYHAFLLRGRKPACEGCHAEAEPRWQAAVARVTPALHAETGFRLGGPHEGVACEGCHPSDLPFAERYADPTAPSYLRTEGTCRGCHEDTHAGQFDARYARCTACHASHTFTPATFTRADHARRYPLRGAHRGVACSQCHPTDARTGVQRFAATPTACRSCHRTPHGDQFARRIETDGCEGCHRPDARTFRIQPFDHARRTGYALAGGHAKVVACDACQPTGPVRIGAETVVVRRYEGTRTACASCHRDVHRGQLTTAPTAGGPARDCAVCHVSTRWWSELRFDHDEQSRFPLAGAHRGVACDRCHVRKLAPDGAEIVQYRPVGRSCQGCHSIWEGRDATR